MEIKEDPAEMGISYSDGKLGFKVDLQAGSMFGSKGGASVIVITMEVAGSIF